MSSVYLSPAGDARLDFQTAALLRREEGHVLQEQSAWAD